MATEYYLELDGIEGESTKTGNENQVEIDSFNWGAANPTSVSQGTGSGAGKVSISEFIVQKSVDKASAKFFQKCCDGTHIATAKVHIYEAGGDGNKVEYLTYEFQEVFVSSVHWSGGGSVKPSESVSFSFKQINVTYWPQSADGTKGDKQQGGWNVATNAAAAGS